MKSKSVDHKMFLSGLSIQEKQTLTQRNTYLGVCHLMGHFGLIFMLGFWIASGFMLWPLAILPLGILLVFLFTLEHECTHKTPFANMQLNECIGSICGVILFLPFRWFRYFHLAHHKWTNIAGKDPEIAKPRPETWAQMALYISGFPYWVSALRQIVSNVRGKDFAEFVPSSARRAVRLEARLMAVLYVLLLGSVWFSNIIFWVWLLPVIVAQPVLRLYLLAEHGQCPQVANMFENTRTTLTNRIIRFVAWNMPYHAEHHVYPNVPFHKLPVLHQKTEAFLQKTSLGYGKFSAEYVKGLKHKI